MVQELHVLRCYSCNIFQVQIVKKVNKWQCKICNEKQSVQKVYFRGSGQECRLQVQHMNLTKHFKDEREFETLKEQVRMNEENYKEEEEEKEEKDNEKLLITKSKWTKYIVEEIDNEKEMEKDNFNTIKNIDENRFSDSDSSRENNFLSETERENWESENPVYRIAECSSNRNSSLHSFTNNDNDNEFNEMNFLEQRNGDKRKFEDDKELNFDHFRSKRIKFDKESFERKTNLRDIIKTNRKKSGKLFDESKSAKEDSVINEYFVNKETILCQSNDKKKTVFQSDLDDLDDNFDL